MRNRITTESVYFQAVRFFVWNEKRKKTKIYSLFCFCLLNQNWMTDNKRSITIFIDLNFWKLVWPERSLCPAYTLYTVVWDNLFFLFKELCCTFKRSCFLLLCWCFLGGPKTGSVRIKWRLNKLRYSLPVFCSFLTHDFLFYGSTYSIYATS